MKLTEEMLHQHLSDGNWRSLRDMAVTLSAASAVPPEIAIRAAPSGTPGADRMVAGYVAMLTPIVTALTVLDRIQTKAENGNTLYAIAPRKSTSRNPSGRPLRVATDDQMTRPANTDSGISLPQIYRLVRDKPGITLNELIAALDKCWRPLPDLVALRNGMYRKAALAAGRRQPDLDPAAMSEEDIHALKKMLVVRVAGRGEVQTGKIKAVTEIRYYFQDGVRPEGAPGGEGGA